MNSKRKIPKQIAILLSALLIISTLSSCSQAKNTADASTTSTTAASNKSIKITAGTVQNITVNYTSQDLDATWNSSSSTSVKLNGSSIALSGVGASVSGSKVTITKSGTYCISGSLSDGQVIVDTQNTDIVKLVLNGAVINCSTSSPIYVKNAKKVVVILADGTENKVTDGSSYKNVDSTTKEPNAAIFSKADLTFNGNGSLTIDANYSHGINSKDKLKIVSGTITVDAVGDGIKGKDMVAVKDGTITVKAKGDGIQSSNTEDAAKGFVCIDGGIINITADLDGIQAETCAAVHGGNISIVAGGGSANGKSHNNDNGPGMGGGNNPGWGGGNNNTSSDTSSSTISTKGIKSAAGIMVTGGTITVDSADDSIHSGGAIAINAGNMVLSSGSKAIHADNNITVNKGDINIKKCYEGIESTNIDVNGGNIRIVSSDDSFNVSDGVSNSQTVLNNGSLDIKGGYIVVDAGGDGLDSNGSITMTAGTVIVNGPTENNNGAVDYNGSFKMTGGLLVAAGSSGMAEAPDTTSTQYVLLVNFTSAQQAGTLVNIATDQGKEILTFAPSKNYQSIVLCSPEVKKGSTYVVSTGGSSTGKVTDSLYSGGTYKGGTQAASLKVSSIVTQYGSSGRGGMGGHDGQGGGRGPSGSFGSNPGGSRN